MPRHLQQRNPAATADAVTGSDTVIAMGSRGMRNLVRTLSMSALGAAMAFSVAACNNQTGFSGSVGNTPNGPPLAAYDILGTVGTPFIATVSDSRSSWTLQGVVPLDIIIANNILPAAIIATKTTSNSNLLSVEIISGFRVANVQSTSAPFGTVSLQIGGTLSSISPPADPDLRIFNSGPLNERYSALVEDVSTGWVIDGRAPTLILFDNPDGKVDATFFGGQDYGSFTLNMTLGGAVVATVVHGPDATIREP
ncbi:MAG: hypothetical protein ABSB13_10410 [Candidatus Binatus sp.]|jgi:hypothetical protein|uniref:hypothetical protein n=1 Tax=Candidatus Binatus sp. TaxID=2811406 RepID=UPI003D0EB489